MFIVFRLLYSELADVILENRFQKIFIEFKIQHFHRGKFSHAIVFTRFISTIKFTPVERLQKFFHSLTVSQLFCESSVFTIFGEHTAF
jgi:hypothetical protein